MKDTSFPLRRAYNTLITGLGYTSFDLKAPDNTPKPYVILGSQTSQSEDDKDRFNNRCTINLDIITSFDDQYTGRKGLDLMVDAILSAALPAPGQTPISLSGFNIYSSKKIIDFDFPPVQNDTQTILRRIITIEHLLEQLN